MKSVLISIKPKNVANIFNGIKKIEIRKTKPKLEAPFKCFIYCTNDTKTVLDQNGENFKFFTDKNYGGKHYFNGKVVGEFICDKVVEYESEFWDDKTYESIGFIHYDVETGEREKIVFAENGEDNTIIQPSCLTWKELREYVGQDFKTFYGWNITNLKIYDEPKEIWNFFNYNKYQICNERNCFSDNCLTCWNNAILIRPPQSWCYVWELEQ